MREMNADLVRSAGVELGVQKVDGIEAGKPYESGSRGLAAGDDRHSLAIARIPGNRSVDRDHVVGKVTPAQRGVSTVDTSSGQRRP
jgi:hypothetical protein